MRTRFIQTLHELAGTDDRIRLIVGDLGFSVIEDFAQAYPDRFINTGIAEQHMIGLAAGLAAGGCRPWCYSIVNFCTLRCVEQIRNDVCYHRLPVRVVSVGAGFAYGSQGPTHHGIEDIAVLRALPGLVVMTPGDPHEAAMATRALASDPRPAYLRLGKAGESPVHDPDRLPALVIGRAITVREGEDLCLIAHGSMLSVAVGLAESLHETCRWSARVLSMPTLKPIDRDAIISAACETGGLFTLEEHSVIGGLGSAVAEVLAESDLPRIRFRRLGVPETGVSEIGSQSYLRHRHILDGTQPIVAQLQQWSGRKSGNGVQ